MEQIIQNLPNFLLIFCRITAFFVTAPVFNSQNIPAQFKIGFSGFLAFIMFTILGIHQPAQGFYALFIVAVLREVVIGMLLGFIAYMFFTAIMVAGTFIDMQIGFGLANIVNPISGLQSPVIANFKYVVATLLFFSINGHQYLINAIVQSYQYIPLSGGGNLLLTKMQDGTLSLFLVKTFANVFSIAIQMSAPIVVSLFLTDVGMGILAKTAPQFNVFVVGIPIKILVGLLMLMLFIPGMLNLDTGLFQQMFENINAFFNILK